MSDAPRITRRRLLAGGATIAAAGTGAYEAVRASGSAGPAPVPLGAQPRGRPARQFAWEATEHRDEYGNPIAPRFDRLLFFDVASHPGAGHRTRLEAALRTLERRFSWGPDGLLFTVGWSHHYFARTLGRDSPIPRARAMSNFELPSIDEYDMVLHLAGDDERRLLAVENALIHGAAIEGLDGPIEISDVLAWRETRTGFAGAGLPAAHQDVGGIPSGHPVPRSAPLYMGFKSGLKRNQASEDSVAIPSGQFAQGTTMAVSYMRLRLDSWYGELDEDQRVARMYAPQMTPEDVRRVRTDAAGDPQLLGQAIHRYGVIGHSQTSARARRNGKPVILRRDFNTADAGQAGLHFVCLQRSVEDFVRTRTAMNASSAPLQNPAITDTDNNGINEFIFVLRRGNYLLPPRTTRSFPAAPSAA